MIKAIVLWLLQFLEESLDPDLKARVERARFQAAVLEVEREKLLQQIADGERINLQLNKIKMANNAERDRLDAEIEQSKADLAQRIRDRAALSDADKVELDL